MILIAEGVLFYFGLEDKLNASSKAYVGIFIYLFI